MVLAIYVYLAVAFLVAIIAMMRGRIGWRWFMASVLLSPLLAGLMLILLPRVRPVHRVWSGVAGNGRSTSFRCPPIPASALSATPMRGSRHASF